MSLSNIPPHPFEVEEDTQPEHKNTNKKKQSNSKTKQTKENGLEKKKKRKTHKSSNGSHTENICYAYLPKKIKHLTSVTACSSPLKSNNHHA
jgi:hypothetical protein